MRISARNILRGKIDVVKGQTTAHVTIDVGGAIVTASITNESVDDLGLKKGNGGVGRYQVIGCHGCGRLSCAARSLLRCCC